MRKENLNDRLELTVGEKTKNQMKDTQRTLQAHGEAMIGSQKAAHSFITPVVLNSTQSS